MIRCAAIREVQKMRKTRAFCEKCTDLRLIHKRKRASAFKRAAAGLRRARGELTMEQNRYMTIHDASRLWHIEAEELRRRCANGKIQGARMVSGIWMIPV